jgi:hypothetical protein
MSISARVRERGWAVHMGQPAQVHAYPYIDEGDEHPDTCLYQRSNA